MRAFLDFEASSLGRHGYPIEVGWIFEDGASDAYLIQPKAEWTDWDSEAEALHGISRNQLLECGVPPERVAARLLQALRGHDVFASAPSWDGKWLSLLLRAGGLPRHAITLVDTDAGLIELAGALLAPSLPSSEIHRATRKILADAAERLSGYRPEHRALADARAERERWLIVSELAHARAAQP